MLKEITMSGSNNNGEEELFDEEESPQLEELKFKFAQLMLERAQLEETITDEEKLRAARMEIYKQMMRAAFLANDLATEKDFARLWPRLRDDFLCGYAQSMYLRALDDLAEEMEDADFFSEDPSDSNGK